MRPRVLLADDHLEMMTAVEHLIDAVGEVVGKVVDGADVLDAVRLLQPDVLVVDLNMPSLDGIEICRQVMRMFPDTSVIVLTAEMDFALRDAAIGAGACAFVQKLSAAEDLPNALAGMRGRPR